MISRTKRDAIDSRAMRIPFSLFALGLPLMVAGLAACPKDSTPATADDGGGTASSTPSSSTTTTPSPSATATDSALAAAADAAVAPKASASASASANAANGDDSDASLPPGATCGKRPLPDCPLQAWMKANTGGAMQSKDFTKLAAALDNTASFAPPGYGTWASISHDGAKAARAQDMDGVKASCRNCHTQFKQRYITEMRARKI